MPIVYVHGVAVRDPDDPAYAAVERLTRGAEWDQVHALLREHVAPVLRPPAPERVSIRQVYWGDLASRREEPVDPGTPVFTQTPEPAALELDELSESLQRKLFEDLPPSTWPAVVRAVWGVVTDSPTRAQLAARSARKQATWLERQVRARMTEEDPELGRRLPALKAEWAGRRRHTVRWTMGEVRRPLQEVVPTFVGDVLSYLEGRGRLGEPGPITMRVREALREAATVEQGPGEPLVVLSHSMGGQLVYDALTAFDRPADRGDPGDPGGGGAGERDGDGIPSTMSLPRVDFWCASGGQLGLFAELGMFLRPEPAAVAPIPPERLGRLWNAWSSTDMLSFPAEGRVAGAHDSDFGWPGTPGTTHLAYLREPDFFRTLAAQVEVHTRAGRR